MACASFRRFFLLGPLTQRRGRAVLISRHNRNHHGRLPPNFGVSSILRLSKRKVPNSQPPGSLSFILRSQCNFILITSISISRFMNTRRQLRQRSDSDLRGIHLWLVLWKAARALEAHARENVRMLGMCASDFGVLEVLLTSGSITTAVDRLERRGWVKRRNDANDRRARVVYLTDSGRRLIRKAFADHEQAMEQTVSALALGERRVLVNLLRKLGRSAEGLLEKRRREAVKGGHWQQKI